MHCSQYMNTCGRIFFGNMLEIIALTIFIVGYILITLEHRLGTHKSAISLALSGILWIIAAASLQNKDVLEHYIAEAGTEVFGIIAFLLAAMALVEILIHYRFFDFLRTKLSDLHLSDKKQFIVMGILTFFLSAVLDNLTVTIVMIQIARRFYKDENLLVAAAGIVILANAGGAWSPIGDVTTIMLWLAGKFAAVDVITQGILPSATLGIIALFLLTKKIKNSTFEIKEELQAKFSTGEKVVILLTLSSFSLPLFMNFLHLPPYMGLLLGLGMVWLLIEFAKTRSQTQTHLVANIDQLLQRTDISSLNFFIGILLSVSALHALGILEKMSHLVLGESPSFERLVSGNVIMGLFSAIIDNVPLTAIAIDTIKSTDPSMWVLTAVTVGTGGSALIIGSVAGVIAMGMVKQLTFDKYLKIATIPALLGYFGAVIVWVAQYHVIN